MGPNGELSDIQQAFIEETAVQCCFCTPGFIMTAVEILDRGVYYDDDQLRKLLSGHLCRCTGYENIFKAVKKTGMQKPHWMAVSSIKACWMSDSSPLGPISPSRVVMCLPSAHTARYRQEL